MRLLRKLYNALFPKAELVERMEINWEDVYKPENFNEWFIKELGMGIFLRRDKLSHSMIMDYITFKTDIPQEDQDERAINEFYNLIDNNWIKLQDEKWRKEEEYKKIAKKKLGIKRNKVKNRLDELRGGKN